MIFSIPRGTRLIALVLLVVVGLLGTLALVVTVLFHAWNQTNGSLVSSGTEREYLLYVPGSYDPPRATPLVIRLHAAALWPAAQRNTSQWNRVADEHGFLVVYPLATRMAPLPFLPLYRERRRPLLARRKAASGVGGRAYEPQPNHSFRRRESASALVDQAELRRF